MIPHKVNDQTAYCLHRTVYGESSYILHCFTEQYGRVSIMAKGAKKRKNQANFQLFQRLQLGFSGKKALKTLTAIDSNAVSLTPKASTACLYVNELLIQFLPEHEPSEALFRAYEVLLKEIEDDNLEQPLRQFEFTLLDFMGVLADFSIDFLDQEPIQKELHYVFYADKGFTKTTQKKGYLGQQIIQVMQQDYDKLSLKLAKQLTRQCIDWQLNGKQLKTRELYKQLYHSKTA